MTRTPNSVCVTIVLTACCLIYAGDPPTAGAESVCYSATEGDVTLAGSIGETMLMFDPEIRDWLKFDDLSRQWKQECGVRSSITDITALTSYQKIIGMGEAAIPLILAQLKLEGDEPDHWFWALRIITDVNPVPAEEQGNMRKMAATWIMWGEREGYARQLAAA